MMAGPEMCRLSRNFEGLSLFKADVTESRHEQDECNISSRNPGGSRQPFTEHSENLLSLDTKDIADPSVVQTVRQIEMNGQDMYKAFVEERFIKRKKKVSDPIKQKPDFFISHTYSKNSN